MAKDKYTLDDDAWNDELDFNFDEDVSSELSEASTKGSNKRHPVFDVVRGTVSGAKETVLSPSFAKRVVKDAMPKEFGEVAGHVGEITSDASQLIDEASRELKPKFATLSKQLERLIPENASLLKKINEKFGKWAGVEQTIQSSAAGSAEDQAVAASLQAIFAQSQAQAKADNVREIVSDRVRQKQSSSQIGLLKSIADDTHKATDYTTSITQGYQKKMLELSIRSYMSQEKHFALFARYMEKYQVQNEALIKNTALPEYAKITASERFRENLKQRTVGKLGDKLFGDKSAFQRGLGKLKQKGKEFIQGASYSLDNMIMGVDMAASAAEQLQEINAMMREMGQPELTVAEQAGAMMGGKAAEFIAKLFTVPMRERLLQEKGLTEKLHSAKTFFKNPSAYIKKIRQSDKWKAKTDDYDSVKGGAYRAMDMLMSWLEDDDTKRTYETGNQLDKLGMPTMAGFDGKAHKSLTEVIPGYLSTIHREIAMLRTGQDAPALVYDYEKGQFTTTGDIARRLNREIGESLKRNVSVHYTNTAAREFAGDEKLEAKEEQNLKRFIQDLSMLPNQEFSPEAIRRSAVYRATDSKTKAIIDRRLTAMEYSERPMEEISKLTDSMMNIKSNIPSLDDRFNLLIKSDSAYAEALEDLGIIVKNERGDYDVQEHVYRRLLTEYSINPNVSAEEVRNRLIDEGLIPGEKPSDRNVKEQIKRKKETAKAWWNQMDVQRPNGQQAVNAINRLPLFKWFYKKDTEQAKQETADDGERTEHFGPMAQDVNRLIGEEAAPGGKAISLQTMNGIALSAIQSLSKKIEALAKRNDPGQMQAVGSMTDQLLSEIKKDTTSLVLLTEEQQRGGEGEGGGALAKKSDKEAGYLDLTGALGSNVFNLFGKAAGDAFSAMGKTLKFGKDNAIKPIAGFLGDQWKKRKEGIGEFFTDFVDKVFDFGGGVLKFGKDMITDTIPSSLKNVKAFMSSIWKKAITSFNEAKDLYLPGGVEPIITAAKLKAGFYRDAATDKLITTMDELLAAKGDIVDAAGNVIVSLKDRAEGLYDRNKELVKSSAVKLGGLIGAAGVYVAKGFGKGAKTLSRAASNVGGWLMNKIGLGNKYDKVKSYLEDKFGDVDWSKFGLGMIPQETNDAIIDIRDFIVGKKEEVLKRMNMREELRKEQERKKLEKEGAQQSEDSGQRNLFAPEGQEPKKGSPAAETATAVTSAVGGSSMSAAMDDVKAAGRGIKAATAKGKEWKEKLSQSKAGQWMGRQKDKLAGTSLGQKASAIAGSKWGKRIGSAMSAGKGLLGAGMSAIGGLFSGGDSKGASKEQAKADADEQRNKLQEQDIQNAAKPEEPQFSNRGKSKWNARQLKKMTGKARESAEQKAIIEEQQKSAVEEQKKKQEEFKKAKRNETAKADLTQRYKSGESFLSKLFDSVKGIFGFLQTGVGQLFNIFSKIPGIGKLTGLAKGAWGGLKGAASFVAKNGLRQAAIQGGRMLLMGGSSLLGSASALGATLVTGATTAVTGVVSGVMAAGSALASVTAAALASPLAPAVLAAVAIGAAGYGIWKLYKRFTRNDASELDKVRLAQYGFNADNSEHKAQIHRVYTLEGYLQENRTVRGKMGMEINMRAVKMDDVFEMFDIKKDDKEHAQKFAQWFHQRFRPVFLMHLNAFLKAKPPKKKDGLLKSIGHTLTFGLFEKGPPVLNDINKLKDEEKYAYLEQVKKDMPEQYNVGVSPVNEIEVLETNPATIVRFYDIALKKYEEAAEKAGKKKPQGAPGATPEGAKDTEKDKKKSFDEKIVGGLKKVWNGLADGPLKYTPIGLIANGIRSLLKAGAAVRDGIKSAAKGVWDVFKEGFKKVVSSDIGRGIMSLMPGGVLVLAAYDYLRTEDTSDLAKLRLAQYGFNPLGSKYKLGIFRLKAFEAWVEKECVKTNEQGIPEFDSNKFDQKKAIQFFDIKDDDNEQITKFLKWFGERFKPVFLMHLVALRQNKGRTAKLADMSRLTPDEAFSYMSMIFKSMPEAYRVAESPMKSIDVLDTASENMEAFYDIAFKKYKDAYNKAVSMENLKPVMPKEEDEAVKKRRDEQKQAEDLKATQAKQLSDSVKKPEPVKPSSWMMNQQAQNDGDGGAAKQQNSGAGSSSSSSNQPGQFRNGPGSSSYTIPTNFHVRGGGLKDGNGGSQFVRFAKGVQPANFYGSRPKMLQNFLGMAQEYGELTGKSIQVNSAFRSYEDQMRLWKADPKKAAKPSNPPRSTHQVGLALDINTVDANELEKLGLMRKYGFTRPIGGETWHIEPAGIQQNIAKALQPGPDQDLMVESSIGRGGGGFGTMPGSRLGGRDLNVQMKLLNMPSSVIRDDQPDAGEPIIAGPAPIPGVNDKPSEAQTQTPAANDRQMPQSGPGGSPTPPPAGPGSSPVQSDAMNLPSPDSIPNPEQKPEDEWNKALQESQGDGKAPPEGTDTDKPKDIKDLISKCARKVGEDPDVACTFAAVESGMRPDAQASTSSAAGLFQFIRSTWNSMVKQYGSKYGLQSNASPKDPEAASLMGAEYIKTNRKALQGVKNDVNAVDLYMAHFLGSGGARQFLKAMQQNPDAIGAQLFPSAAAANKSIFYANGRGRSLRDIYTLMGNKLKKQAAAHGISLKVDTTLPSAQKQESSGDLPTTNQPAANDTPTTSAQAATPAAPTQTGGPPSSTSSSVLDDSRSGGNILSQTASPGMTSNNPPVESSRDGVGSSMGEATSVLKKSFEVQTAMATTLESILNEVKIERLVPALAAAITAAAPAGQEETPKEKDKRNMNRTSQVPEPALDTRRRAA